MQSKNVDQKEILGFLKGKNHKGAFEGDIKDGELLAGQISSLIKGIMPVNKIIKEIMEEYEMARKEVSSLAYEEISFPNLIY